MRTIKFVGTMVAVSPLAVSMPAEAKLAKQSAIKMPRNAQNHAYFPASSIRGWLRSISLFALNELIQKEGLEPLTVDQQYMYGNGVDTARVLESDRTGKYEKIGENNAVRAKNPLLSLFGRWGLSGVLSVGNALPNQIENTTVILGDGTRQHPFNRNGKLLSFVKDDEVGYLKDILNRDALVATETADLKDEEKSLKRELKTADAERKKEIFSRLAEIDEAVKAVKEASSGSKEAIQRPLSGFEAIDAGVELMQSMTLLNPSDDEFNAFLWVLSKASADLRLGGHHNVGCGEVEFSWNVIESTFDNPKAIKLGEVILNRDGFEIKGIEFDPQQFEENLVDGTFDLKKIA